MKETRTVIDEHWMDELVSGQLTGDRYRAALKLLDAEPQRWRDCALAFLEDQALRAELRELVNGPIDWCAEETKSAPIQSDSHEHSAIDTSVHAKSGRRNSSEEALPMWPRLTSGLLSTAALLLVSFTIGWLGSELYTEHFIGDRTVPTQPTNSAVGGLAQSSVAPRPSVQSSPVSPSIAPQYVLGEPSSFMSLDFKVPKRILELERQGKIRLESHDVLMPATLADGSSAFIPVQEYHIKSRTFSY